MQLLVVQDAGTSVGAQGDTLVVKKAGALLSQVRSGEVQEVHLYGAIELSAPARRLLLRRGVDVLFFSPGGVYEGRLLSEASSAGDRRVAQLRALTDPQSARGVARSIVAGKIRNQRAFLRAAQRHRQDPTLASALASMRQTLRHVESGEEASLDTLRGWEGYAAATYFSAFNALLLNPLFSFNGRNRRPPRDEVNALLSFGYTLLLRRVESAIRAVGLDPYVGALHAAGRGKPALALDLMEEFRAGLIDRLCLRLINRRQLHPSDFEDPGVDQTLLGAPPDPSGPEEAPPRAVYLGPTGRAIFLRAFYDELRATVQHPEEESAVSYEGLIRRQAMQLAHVVEGTLDGYQAWALR